MGIRLNTAGRERKQVGGGSGAVPSLFCTARMRITHATYMSHVSTLPRSCLRASGRPFSKYDASRKPPIAPPLATITAIRRVVTHASGHTRPCAEHASPLPARISCCVSDAVKTKKAHKKKSKPFVGHYSRRCKNAAHRKTNVCSPAAAVIALGRRQ